MPDLPKKKVGIVACSGEELAEGTVTRLAALQVLEQLRPGDTVTICLPLFLAGGAGDRAFAKFYPTIAIDGCVERCAARATERYSGKPAASVVVADLAAERGLGPLAGRRHLNEAGQLAVAATAEQAAALVDELLEKRGWSRRTGAFVESAPAAVEALTAAEAPAATCACGSGIPVSTLTIDGQPVTLAALPLILEQFHAAGKPPADQTARELLEAVGVYNPIPGGAEEHYAAALLHEYRVFCGQAHDREISA
jgi:uncharacterized metal-binding protein